MSTDLPGTGIELVEEPTVHLVDSMGSDASICQAARVSTVGENEDVETERDRGLINYLVKNRHGSPFEHATLKFYVDAPIFVFREFHRHRAGWSYNETSGRYRELAPRFYLPNIDRPLLNVGSSARPEFSKGPEEMTATTRELLGAGYMASWQIYRTLLDVGVANEVARLTLPMATMSQMYATCNPRSLMHFLSLRVSTPQSRIRSRPQFEIQQVALAMEEIFAERFPKTYAAFWENGRQPV